MLFTKIALVTSVFYIGLNILLEVGLLALAHWKGVAGISFLRGGTVRFLWDSVADLVLPRLADRHISYPR